MSKTTNIGIDISSQRLENPSFVRLCGPGADSKGEGTVACPGARTVSGGFRGDLNAPIR